MLEQIREMLRLQDNVNTISSHKDWRNWLTLTWKIINWKRCIYMETAEAIDSVSWKHWKNIEWGIDYENFKVELIDIWHFLMSYLLTKDSFDDTLKLIYQNVDWNNAKVKLPSELNKDNNLALDDILLPYEELMELALLKTNSEEYRVKFIKQFFVCLDSAWVSFQDLYILYIGKNVLNKFRQDNGYKEWTYKKIWSNGEEDNVTMQKVLRENPDFSFDEVYAELEKEYKK